MQIALFVFALFAMESCRGFPTKMTENKDDILMVKVPIGATAILKCASNDRDHNFFFWYYDDRNVIVGPTNNDYDDVKYDYEILSGNLTIRAVSSNEEGLYNCVSRGVREENKFNIRSVRMIVEKGWEEVYENSSSVNAVRVTVVIITLLVVSVVVFFAYRIYKNRYRNPSYLVQTEEDDDSVEEIFNAPRSTTNSSHNIVKNYPNSRVDTPGMSTDFSSILDAVNDSDE